LTPPMSPGLTSHPQDLSIVDTKSSPGELSNQKPTAHQRHRNNSESVRDKSHTNET
jgi:hypothetical protein